MLPTRFAIVAVLVAFALVAAGCSESDDPPPSPEATADALVGGLVTGNIGAVPVIVADNPDADAAAIRNRWARITDGLPLPAPSVVIRSIDQDPEVEDHAVVNFTVRWTVAAGHEWAYDSSAPLRLVGDAWHVEFSPSIVEPSLRPGEVLAVTSAGDLDQRGRILAADGTSLTEDAVDQEFVGSVGPATAELIDASNGRIRDGDTTGHSGLQLRYDEVLAGTRAIQVVARSGDGSERTLFEIPGTEPRDVHTTLDPTVQQAALAALVGIDTPSSLVAIRPSDGHVLALANGTGSGATDTARLARLPPGSTFKIIATLGMLRAGLGLQSEVECPETVFAGREFSNHSGFPSSLETTIPLRSAIANSCNTAVIGQHELVDPQALADAATALGIGEMDDLGASAFEGSVPTDTGTSEHAAQMIGQGRVVVSPLNMATATASVAAGRRVRPQLVLEDDPRAAEATAGPASVAPITPREARQLRDIMVEVVSNGTATLLADVPGEPVGAKTGTAEYGSIPDGEDELPTHAWLIAFQGDLAVAVFVAEGEAGSSVAGPVVEAFLRSYSVATDA